VFRHVGIFRALNSQKDSGETIMPAEPYDRLSVATADDFARARTAGRIRVRFNGGNVTMWREGQRVTIHLLPYQLTEQGIDNAIAENEPWPEN
jgi:hypothetical protein